MTFKERHLLEEALSTEAKRLVNTNDKNVLKTVNNIKSLDLNPKRQKDYNHILQNNPRTEILSRKKMNRQERDQWRSKAKMETDPQKQAHYNAYANRADNNARLSGNEHNLNTKILDSYRLHPFNLPARATTVQPLNKLGPANIQQLNNNIYQKPSIGNIISNKLNSLFR
jgi:hypothetical protein